ncbi:hypothetical protein SEPCBS119000_005813 [Sporothrix epigloea]|uniref:Uncharacterized protein n=1 Tax=Sporothrix epigloea TaxID=1892477 RepID=A0ABP0DZK4_9PEZI
MSLVNRSGSISGLLEPAMEGPPSPETLRAISKQMRLASTMEKQHSHLNRQSHRATSSASSSLRSTTSVERPSWDNKTSNYSTSSLSLSRNSSGRSTASAHLRDHQESVQIFGKTIFSRRGKLRRESTAQTSSTRSFYSAKLPSEKGVAVSSPPPRPPSTAFGLPTSGPKEALLAAFFSRRRASTKPESPSENVDGRRRLQISGPFNFQHLTQPQNSCSLSPSELDVIPAVESAPADGSVDGLQTEESLDFPNILSEALPVKENISFPAIPQRYPMRPHAASASSVYPPSRTLQHSRSQDQLRTPPTRPPRPPRSPVEASAFFPPSPPARLSSRASLQPAEMGSSTYPKMERPRTSGDARRPMSPGALPRPILTHGHSYSADIQVPSNGDAHRFFQLENISSPLVPVSETPYDSNWPLAAAPSTFTSTIDILPGVPEEEEQLSNPRTSTRKSRMSIASNASSLRKSHSLPLLQQFPLPGHRHTHSQSSSTLQRPPSAASDTLGHSDLMAAQRSLRDLICADDVDVADSLGKAKWEDDIDYCYEHEIEADCEYAWDRPLIELSREVAFAGVAVGSEPGYFDVPYFCRDSQMSAALKYEDGMPASPGTAHSIGLAIQAENMPHPSGLDDAQGFQLSPSLFVPDIDNENQFRLPMRCGPMGFTMGADEDEFLACGQSALGMDKLTLFIPSRMSASATSTTASRESRDSFLSGRHISANSTATDLTRLTVSTASTEDLVYKKELDVSPI